MKRLNLILLFLSSFIVSFAQDLTSENDINQIDGLYEQGINHLEEDSAKAFSFFDEGLAQATKANDEQRMIKGFLNLIGFYRHYGNHQASIDKSLQVLGLGISFSRDDSLELMGYMGGSLDKMGAYEMAIDYQRKKIFYLNDSYETKKIYYPTENIAFLYLKLEQYDSANYYYEKAHRLAEIIKESIILMHCLNNIGYSYMTQGDFKKSEKYYNMALKLFEANPNGVHKDSLLYALAMGNLGVIFQKKNQHARAVQYFVNSNKILSSVDQTFLPDNYIRLAHSYMSLDDFDLAKYYLDQAEDNLVKEVDKLSFYPALARYYLKSKAYKLAVKALQNHSDRQTKLLTDKSKDEKVNDLRIYQANRIKNELRLLQQLRKRDEEINALRIRVIMITSAAGFLLFLFIFLKYQSDRKKKDELKDAENRLNKERLSRQKLERERLEEELRYKNKDLTDFAIDITRKHEFIETILVKLNDLLQITEGVDVPVIELIHYVKAQQQIGDNLKMFQENVDTVNHEFISLLVKEYPNLTTNEQQICSLLRLQLSTKEIATIKNIEIDSVKTMRYRIRKKLAIDPEINLNQFLKTF